MSKKERMSEGVITELQSMPKEKTMNDRVNTFNTISDRDSIHIT